MYASFRSVTAKNGKMLTPNRTGNFLLTSMDAEFYATDWPGGNGLCKIQGTLIEISYTASILTLVAISHERSRSVRSTSLARNRSVAQRTIVIKILWIVAIVVCTPLFYGYATEEEMASNSARIRSGETTEDKRTTCFKLCCFLSAL